MITDQKRETQKPHFPGAQGIEVGYDHDFFVRWLRFEKAAWFLIAVFLLAGLSGIFGRGPFAKATVKAGDGTEVRYERIARNKTPAVVEIRLPESLASTDTVLVRLEGDLLSRGRFERIIPQPARETPIAHGIVAEVPISHGEKPGKIAITQQPGSPGKLWNRVTLENTGTHVEFSQVVLP